MYAAKDLEKNTMIIEYIGDLIRNEVANRREKLYEAQVCYRFFYFLNTGYKIYAFLTIRIEEFICFA